MLKHLLQSLTCLFFALILSLSAQAAAISSTATGGNWNVGGTWVGGVVPGSADDVTIVSGATVIVNVPSLANTLIVNGTLNVNSGSNDLTIANGGSVQ
jgi:hypothetical protein